MKYNNDAELIDILDLECIIIFNDSFNGKEHHTIKYVKDGIIVSVTVSKTFYEIMLNDIDYKQWVRYTLLKLLNHFKSNNHQITIK